MKTMMDEKCNFELTAYHTEKEDRLKIVGRSTNGKIIREFLFDEGDTRKLFQFLKNSSLLADITTEPSIEPEQVKTPSRARRLFRAAFALITVPLGIYGALWLLFQYLTFVVEYFRPEYGFYRALPFVLLLAVLLPIAGILAACAAYGSDK